MLKQKLKRFLSCILSVLTVFGCLTESLSVFAEKIELPNGREGEIITAEAVFGRHTVQPSGEGYNRFLMYDGVPKADDFAYWVYEDTGEKYPAYCVSPTKPGVTELGSYDVNVKELTTDPKLYWILRHGYPYNTPEELSVSDEDEAYAATKMALWTSLNGWDLNKWAVNPNCTVPGDHSDVLAALKNIVAAAAKDEVLGVPNYHVTIVPESSEPVLDSVDSDYYSVTYHFEYDERINPLSVQVQWKSTQPPGAKITREDNTETGYFKIDEKVKLLVPKDWADQQTGSQTISLAMFFTSWMRPAMQAYLAEVRRISDDLCRQYGLSVIQTERSEWTSLPYAQWVAEQSGKPTWKTAIRQDLDRAISESLTWKQFLIVLKNWGYIFRFDRKYPTLTPLGKERPVRFKTLGKNYTPEAIRQRILSPKPLWQMRNPKT